MPKVEKTLSVFVDESGTFRYPDPSSRYYIVALVFHDQSFDISQFVRELDAATERMGLDPESFASHAGPLIRKEKTFAPFRREWRAKVFKLLFDFARRVEFAQNVRPKNYKLFQVADLVCTASLIERRLLNGERMTESEYAFFGGPRSFRRNVLKYIKRKELA